MYFGEGRNIGKDKLNDKLRGYAAAAEHGPWFITRDLDHDDDCALRLRDKLIANVPDMLCFRIAVRQVESWLIADKHRLANHLGISAARLSANPDQDDDPKETIIAAARRSKRRQIKESIPPRPGSGRKVGVGYREILENFVEDIWQPQDAMENSDSLANTIRRLARLRITLEN